MVLTWPVAAAVLLGALLHAGWNALLKSGTDKAMDTALLQLIGSCDRAAAGLRSLAGRRPRPGRSSWPRSRFTSVTTRRSAVRITMASLA